MGYFTVERAWLGEDDPTWTEPPVLIDIVCLTSVCCPHVNKVLIYVGQMVREFQTPDLKEKGHLV